MITFYNIKVVDGTLTALAVNEVNNTKENIVAKVDGSYHSSKNSDIVRATWGMIWEAKKNKKFPEKTTIAWG